ncbi:MAG: SPOCS domain-containing protein [Clostridium sp.]
MHNLNERLIEYGGISEYIPKNISSSRDVDVESIITLCKDNYKIKEVIKVTGKPKIKSQRVIKTPKGVSLEGQVLSGKKFIIEGEVKLRIDYLCEGEENKIYCLHYSENFSAGVVLHKDIISSNNFIPSLFMENIHCDLLSNEEILIITTILATVEI